MTDCGKGPCCLLYPVSCAQLAQNRYKRIPNRRVDLVDQQHDWKAGVGRPLPVGNETMKSVVLSIPDTEMPPFFDLAIYLACKLYEDGLLSAGQAAALANLSKRAFI